MPAPSRSHGPAAGDSLGHPALRPDRTASRIEPGSALTGTGAGPGGTAISSLLDPVRRQLDRYGIRGTDGPDAYYQTPGEALEAYQAASPT